MGNQFIMASWKELWEGKQKFDLPNSHYSLFVRPIPFLLVWLGFISHFLLLIIQKNQLRGSENENTNCEFPDHELRVTMAML